MSKMKIGLIVVGVLFVFYVLGKCNEANNPVQAQKLSTGTNGFEPDTSQAAPEVETKSAANWTYESMDDKMGTAPIMFASTTAKELLEFDFPYQGGSAALFTVRKKRGQTDITLQVTKGQFHGQYDNEHVKIRFDQSPAKNYSYNGAADGSSDIIFLSSVKDILARLKTAKTMVIEAEFFSNGVRQMEFNVSGLDITKLNK